MATTTAAAAEGTLQDLAKRHLWMHFSRMGAYNDGAEIPIIVRGDGCYVWDDNGNKYLDGLSALFCVNIGHGRADVAQAGADQAKELGFFTTWSYAHPRAIELAARLASLAPGDLNRVFFTSGGGEAVETALKLARQYHKLTGHPNKTKVIAREVAYHGTTMGALTRDRRHGPAPALRAASPRAAATCRTRTCTACRTATAPRTSPRPSPHRIEFEGPDTVAAVIMEPVQNAGGCFVPPEGYFDRVREICDQYDVLMISDEVICAYGRIGYMFGCERYGYQPDIITTAKGLTSSYAPMGAVITADKVMEPFLEGKNSFAHGFTWGGHPMCAAVALANLDVFENEGLLEHVRENEDAFRAMLESLRDIEIVGDVRGTGYFYALELVKDRETRQSFSSEEGESLLRGFVSPELYRRGLICRADDRGDPVLQLSPPLIAGPEHFEEMESVLRPVLEEASRRMLHA